MYNTDIFYLYLLCSRHVTACQGSGGGNDLVSAGTVQCVHEKTGITAPR